jgi:S-methylmethionine-dependent homocysteine/selenocysteine methylase
MAHSLARMEKRHPVLERLSRGQSIVLDGGVGTELARRGYRPAGPLHDAAAARDAPETLTAVHRAFVDAGADVLTAFTARTTVRALARGGVGMRAAALTNQAVDLAHEVATRAGRPVAVAGVLASLEDSGHPERTPSPRTLADEHGEQATRLHAAGCDLVLVDAMPTLRETLAATAAARAAMPAVWTVLALEGRAHTADGVALADAAAYAASVGAQAVLLESASIPDLVAAVATLAGLALGVPLGVRASRAPDDTALPPDRFALELAQAMQRGARILGGASGATPDQIRALAHRVHTRAAA